MRGIEPCCGEDSIEMETKHDCRQSGVQENELRRRLEAVFQFDATTNLSGDTSGQRSKLFIRTRHIEQRAGRLRQATELIAARGRRLLDSFAEGREIEPRHIEPELATVAPGTEESALFRFATLWWSVPVSQGYGGLASPGASTGRYPPSCHHRTNRQRTWLAPFVLFATSWNGPCFWTWRSAPGRQG